MRRFVRASSHEIYGAIPSPFRTSSGFPRAIAATIRFVSTGYNAYAVVIGKEGNFVHHKSFHLASTTLNFRASGPTAEVALNGPTVVVGRIYRCVGISFTNALHHFYVDGQLVATSTSDCGAFDPTLINRIWVGNETWDHEHIDADVGEIAVWDGSPGQYGAFLYGVGVPALEICPGILRHYVPLLNDVVDQRGGARLSSGTAGLWVPHSSMRRRPRRSAPKAPTASAFTAAVALEFGALETAIAAPFSPGTKTATVALTFGAFQTAAAATHTPPTFAGSAALTFPGLDTAAAGTFAPGTKTATAALTFPGLDTAINATFSPPVFSASAALVFGNLETAIAATFVQPVYSGTIALTFGNLETAASATFATAVFLGSVSLTFPGLDTAIAATFSPGTKTATAALTFPGLDMAASGTVTQPVYSSSLALVFPGLDMAASGTFTKPTYTGSVGLTFPGLDTAITATFSAGTKTATVALVFPGLDMGAAAAVDNLEADPPGPGLIFTASGEVGVRFTASGEVGVRFTAEGE